MTKTKARTVAVLGAGSSGQAMAAFLSLSGYRVHIWNRPDESEVHRWLEPITEQGGIRAQGWMEGTAKIDLVTTELATAVTGADVILITTTADALQSIGKLLAPHISDSQCLILMSSGSLGTLDVWRGLIDGGFTDDLVVGETTTTPFGSQIAGPGSVHISGQKKQVGIASLPCGHHHVFTALLPEIPFSAVTDVLESGLDNIGPSLHVAPMVLNAGWVEAQGGKFLYYQEGITPSVAAVAERVDEERLAIARAYGCRPPTLSDYLTNAVGAPKGTLYDAIHGCVMYADVLSPVHLDHRFLWEDVIAGAVPLLCLAELAEVQAPTLASLVALSSALLGRDLRAGGRTTENLGLGGFTVQSLRELVTGGETFSDWKNKAIAMAGSSA